MSYAWLTALKQKQAVPVGPHHHLSPLYILSTFINHGPPLRTGQYTCTCSVNSTRDGVEWIWPLTDDQVHTQTCGLHVSQVIVCSYVPWWQECMLGWGVEGEGVSMKCCIIWRSSSWRNGWSPDRVIHIWIKMFVCLYAGRCKLQVSVWPRDLTFGFILITHCHWDMRKMLCSLQ